jgi:exodeoxyribonuclease V gamma subunit
MPINIYCSNNYNLLTDKLSKIYHNEQLSVFRTEYIFYQAKSVIDRLPIDLALINGFFGGASFQPFFKIEEIILNQIGEKPFSGISEIELKWKFFLTLDLVEFKKKAPAVAAYYESDDIKRMMFAVKMQQLFTDYLEFRPEMLKIWEEGVFIHPDENIQWQALLWQLTVKNHPDFATKVNDIYSFMTLLNNNESKQKLKNEIPRIFFFGISNLSERSIEIIHKLSEIIDIQLFLFTAINENNLENNLIRYLGNPAKETLELLQARFDKNVFEFIFNSNEHHKTNLSTIQKYSMNELEDEVPFELKNDSSLTINSCYTPIRELEALYHRLLSLNMEDPDILPKDILVLIPNIEDYSPFIASVFHANHELFNFPYSIEKQSYSSSDSPAGVLNILLNFDDNQFTSEQLVQLLENPYLSKIFGIEDQQKIREFIKSANIRFGYEGSGDCDNETYIVSFKYGLQRLIYGFALGENIDYKSDSISFEAPEGSSVFPVGEFEGSSDIITLSKFKAFVEAIDMMLEKRKGIKTIAEWLKYIRDFILDTLIYREDRDDSTEDNVNPTEDSVDIESITDIKFLEKMLLEFDQHASSTETKISFEIFRILFDGFISDKVKIRSGLKGGITFAQYQSVQGLRYKFVAILGMNYDALPRTEQHPSFYVMNERKKGDLSLKDGDKYTFLQSIFSAEKYLYLSYLGRNPKDNSHRPPSILAELLLNLFDKKTDKPRPEHSFWTQHPLHSFSSKYNNPSFPSLKRFSMSTKKHQESLLNQSIDEYAEPIKELSLEKLISFFKNPFKHYFNHVVNLYFDEEEIALPEYEPFELKDGMILHQVKNKLMILSEDETEAEQELSDYIREGKHFGFFPLTNTAEKKIITEELLIKHLRAQYRTYTKEVTAVQENHEIVLDNGILLRGNIKTYHDYQLSYSVSKTASTVYKHILEAWLRHLFCTASNLNANTRILLLGDEICIPKNRISQKESLQLLSKLYHYYEIGSRTLLAYDPAFEMGVKYSEVVEKTYDDYLRKAADMNLFDYSKLEADTAMLEPFLLKNITDLLNIK